MIRRMFSRLTVSDRRRIDVKAHHRRISCQPGPLSDCANAQRTHHHRVSVKHPQENGSADVSNPHTANAGVMAKISAALVAAITSAPISMHRRKVRTSTRQADAMFRIDPMDGR
jgi:hypothetical protein